MQSMAIALIWQRPKKNEWEKIRFWKPLCEQGKCDIPVSLSWRNSFSKGQTAPSIFMARQNPHGLSWYTVQFLTLAIAHNLGHLQKNTNCTIFDPFTFSVKDHTELSLSCPRGGVGGVLTSTMHIFPNNGSVNMVCLQNESTISCQSILHVQSCKLDHWLPRYSSTTNRWWLVHQFWHVDWH